VSLYAPLGAVLFSRLADDEAGDGLALDVAHNSSSSHHGICPGSHPTHSIDAAVRQLFEYHPAYVVGALRIQGEPLAVEVEIALLPRCQGELAGEERPQLMGQLQDPLRSGGVQPGLQSRLIIHHAASPACRSLSRYNPFSLIYPATAAGTRSAISCPAATRPRISEALISTRGSSSMTIRSPMPGTAASRAARSGDSQPTRAAASGSARRGSPSR